MSLDREKLNIHARVLRKRFNAEGAAVSPTGISYIVSLDFDIPEDKICDLQYIEKRVFDSDTAKRALSAEYDKGYRQAIDDAIDAWRGEK